MVALMVGLGLFGTLAGFLLDRRFETSPWLLMVCSLVGLFAGLAAAIGSALAFSHRQQRNP